MAVRGIGTATHHWDGKHDQGWTDGELCCWSEVGSVALTVHRDHNAMRWSLRSPHAPRVLRR